MPNFSFLACLEVVLKVPGGVVGWGAVWWLRPILVFSLSQAEQKCLNVDLIPISFDID